MRRFSLIGSLAVAFQALLGTMVGAQNNFGVPEVPSLTVEADREDLEAWQEAKQAIDRKQYLSAVRLLQFLIDRPEDSFLKKDFKNEHAAEGGLRKQAVRLIQSLPADGIAAYDLEYGATASQMLATAIENDDDAAKAEVARRFAATSAGYQAVISLAAQAADQNHALEAALLIEPLRYHPKRQPQLALQRAVYWSRAGRLERGVAALRELKKTVPSGKLHIAGDEITLPTSDDQAAPWLTNYVAKIGASPVAVDSWLLPGGNAARNASAQAASPVGGNAWRVSTLEHLSLDGRPDEDRRHRAGFQEVIDRIRQSLIEENRPLLTAAEPLVIGDKVVYRTIGDVTAVSLKTGELLWRSSLLDESLVRLINPLSMDARLRNSRAVMTESHLEQRVYRDLTSGTISSDGETVFALEELERAASFSANALGMVSEPRPVNKLVAYDLAGGRMLWEVGGPRGSLPEELSSQFFLGPPLSVDGLLYVMSEVQGALKLSALKQDEDRRSVQVQWSQTLVSVNRPVSLHMPRRLSGLSPSISDGILVCPTSSGAVVAIDLARRSLLWGFQYPSSVQPAWQNGFNFQGRSPQDIQLEEADKSSRWTDNTVVIAEGKVLVTPRDAGSLYCLDLVDGHELWRLNREEWLYVACVVDGRVVLVGRHGVGAVQLADGTEAKSFAEAEVEPAGRGVRVGTSYFLPTTTGEIATIDLRTGQVVAQSKLAQGMIPGNLAAGSGAIVALGASDLIGFAPLSTIQQRIADELKTNAQDPRALALRGELRLHSGDEANGLKDLRESLAKRPDPYVKSVLAASLLASARAKPATIGDYVTELETLTDDPQQKNEYLRLYSQSLEAAGDRRGAFAQLIRLAQTAQFLDDMLVVESGYSVRTGRSIRARLIGMYAAASPEEQVELDRTLEQHIRSSGEGVEKAKHLERCLRFFSGLPKAESLLLQLTMQLEDGKRRADLLKAFLRSSDNAIAARATASQCVSLIAEEQYAEAVPLISRLRTEFADQECLNGQNGRSLAEKWGAEEPLRTLMATPTVWAAGSIGFRRINTPNGSDQPASIPCEVVSRDGPSLAGWSFETDVRGAVLTARDAAGALRWALPLLADDAGDPEGRNALSSQIWIHDNWLIISRWSHFLAIDSSAATPRIAWQQSLRTSIDNQQQTALAIARRQNGRVGQMVGVTRQGQVVGITRETVIYTIGSKFRACELETGRLAWSRQDVGSGRFEATADDQAVMIHLNGITLLRTLDGARLAKRLLHPGTTLWSRGSQLLVARSKGERTNYEMRNTVTDSVTWSQDFPNQSLASLVEDEDLAVLEPKGQLVMLRLVDGRERYRTELPIKIESRDKSWFAVQRCLDRDIVLGGETYVHRPGAQIMPFVNPIALPVNRSAVAFEGFVCSVAPADGKLQWATAVEKAAFDRSQQASLPVLLLATRHADGRMNGNPFSQRLRVNADLLDKRTGRRIYSTEELSSLMPPRLEADPDEGRITANFNEWQLELTVPAAPKLAP
jgi:outer membrane protein assembly factor BamB